MKTILRKALALSLAMGLAVVVPPHVHAQSATGPDQMGEPTTPTSAHDHSGPIGELLLEIEHNLRCNCTPCGMDAHSCQYQMQCDVSPAWTARIRRDLEAGISREEIEASFVADYGMSVLMAPPPEGFNLVGYLLPGATILLAGALIGMVARGRMTGSQLAPVTEIDDEDAERLRAELQKLDKSESPDW